jgi:hypothetical protein
MTAPRDVYVTTASGRTIHPFHTPEEIAPHLSIADIAHHLANICRFTGAVRSFYSVAQHSVLCAQVAEQKFVAAGEKQWAALALQALVHDGPEAVMNDLAGPIKLVDAGLEAYHLGERNMAGAIGIWLHLPSDMPDWLNEIDAGMCAIEMRTLLPNAPVRYTGAARSRRGADFEEQVLQSISNPWPSGEGKVHFLDAFTRLCLIRSEQAGAQASVATESP